MKIVKKSSYDDKFVPVKVTIPFLGIDKGTVLKFDAASGKYLSAGASEDIGEDEYYYSGFAVALDPMVIATNPEFFKAAPQKKIKKELKVVEEDGPIVEEEKVEEPKVEVPVEEPKVVEEPEVKVDETKSVAPEIVPVADLKFECGLCHTVNKITKVKYGLFFPVAPATKLILVCNNCGIETTVYYDMVDEPIQESK